MSEPEQPDRKENEHVSVRFKKKPGCIIRLECIVKKESVQATYKKALKEVKKEISIPGFRKGKVPDDIVEKRFSQALQAHFKDLMTHLAFVEGTKLIQRYPLNKKSVKKVEVHSLKPEAAADILFEFEASPEVPQIDPKTLDLHLVEPKAISDADVEHERLKLRLLHAKKAPVEERGAQEGDCVQIMVTALDETLKAIIPSSEHFLKEGFSPPWLLKEVLQMKKGEKKQITLDEKPVQLICEEVLSCELPEENDQFAELVKAENKEDLLAKIRTRLAFDAQFQAFEKMRHQVKNELIRLYAFDLPQSLIEGETEARFRPFLEVVQKQSLPVDLDKVKKEFSDEVKRYYTLLFLLQPITQKVDTKLQQSDVLEELSFQMMHAPFETRYMYPGLPEEEAQQRLLIALLTRKCEDWCIYERLGVTPPKKEEPLMPSTP